MPLYIEIDAVMIPNFPILVDDDAIGTKCRHLYKILGGYRIKIADDRLLHDLRVTTGRRHPAGRLYQSGSDCNNQ